MGESHRLNDKVALLRRWKTRKGFVSKSLTKFGYDVIDMNDVTFDPRGVGVVWMQGNANWFPRARRQIERMARADRPKVMVWHSEPLPFPRKSGFPQPRLTLREVAKIALRDERATDAYTNFRRLRHMRSNGILDLCVVSARSRQSFLAERGVSAHFVPLGFHEAMGARTDGRRDIDVLFIGTLDDPRHRRAIAFLRESGVKIEARGGWTDPATWGDARTTLINRARIFLNIQRHPGQFSGYRMMLGMGNGAMVMSEPVHDPFPYEPGVHYVSEALEKMPATIQTYLSDDAARNAIVESGFCLTSNLLRMEGSVRRVADLMDAMLLESYA